VTTLPGDERAPGRAGGPGTGGFTPAMRCSPELADVAAQLLSVLFPDRRFVGAAEGDWCDFAARPALAAPDSRRLLGHLQALVERPEWARRHAVAREVADAAGRRVEALVPLAPAAYRGGEALVGPFAAEADAAAWAAGVQVRGLAADTLRVGGAWLVDLFRLGELLAD